MTWIQRFLRRRTLDRDVEREIAYHMDRQTDDLVGQGVDPDEAARRVRLSFGGRDQMIEATRDARGTGWLEDAFRDVRYAFRTVASAPGFATVAILTLGLGIGANTAIFSLIHGVLLKPLPYDPDDRLVLVRQSTPLTDQTDVGVSIKELYDYRAQLTSFDGLVEFHQMTFDLLRQGEPDKVSTGVVSPNFFDVLGIRPLLGRTFVEADDVVGAEAVLVLGHAYWQTRFGGDPDIVGQVFEMNDRPHTVVGVLPAVPQYPREVDVYMPTSACPFRAAAELQIEQNRRAFPMLQVFGRLRPDVTREAAATEVTAVGERFRRDFPAVYRAESGFRARTVGVLEELTRDARPLLLILLGTTALVLLIACANVANLTLARLLRRHRELALRAALGAGRRRLIRQLLTESTLMATLGGAVGVVFAWATLDLLSLFVARFTVRTSDIAINPYVLLFTLAVSILTGLVFGTVPAFSARVELSNALRTSGAGGQDPPLRQRLQSGLVVAQVAVSVVLLVGAGLLLLSFYRLQQVDPGYRGDRVTSAEIFGNFTKYSTPESLRRLYGRILDRFDTVPNLQSVAITNAVPLATSQPGATPFQIEGSALDDPQFAPTADMRIVSPAYFETLSIPVVRGRVFNALDHEEAARVAVVNQAVTRYWDGRDPIGTRVSANGGQTWYTVVGVVGDVRQFGLDREAVAQVYVPLAQAPVMMGGQLLVRVDGNRAAALPAIRAAVRAVDPDLPIENVRTLDEIRATSLATPRLTAWLLVIFATLAMVVTVTGLTGVIATSVSRRTQEFGMRMALGATRVQVVGMVLDRGLRLVVIGLAVGTGAALFAGRVLQGYLYDTTLGEPLPLLAVAITFAAVGALACLGPAWRATSVDPIKALRVE